jgi:cobalt-zinc-cadmium efflux system protein
VHGVHNLHATMVATGLPVHLAAMLDELQACRVEPFDVEHSTFQFDRQVHTDHEHATHA